SAFGTSPRCTGGGTAWLPPLLAGAGWGGGDACASPSASTTAITAPCSTLSPTLTLTSLITPAALAGTSIVALADSSVTRLWSFSMRSPAFTSTSITGTSWKSPMSGTFNSIVLLMRLLSFGFCLCRGRRACVGGVAVAVGRGALADAGDGLALLVAFLGPCNARFILRDVAADRARGVVVRGCAHGMRPFARRRWRRFPGSHRAAAFRAGQSQP